MKTLRTKFMIIIFNLGLLYGLQSQELLEMDLTTSCSYYGEELEGDIYSFNSTNEAIDIIDEMVALVGLKRNFIIQAASVPNAMATIYGIQRYILYSQHFISRLTSGTNTDWAAISVLAHEVGHHLNGHTLIPGGSRPPTELEADEFSGHILYQMGCPDLTTAQSAINLISTNQGSVTHPPKSARLEAIAVGWAKAENKYPRSTTKNEQRKEDVKEIKKENLEEDILTYTNKYVETQFKVNPNSVLTNNNYTIIAFDYTSINNGNKAIYHFVEMDLFKYKKCIKTPSNKVFYKKYKKYVEINPYSKGHITVGGERLKGGYNCWGFGGAKGDYIFVD